MSARRFAASKTFLICLTTGGSIAPWRFKAGSLNDVHCPSEVNHQPSPRLLEIRCPEADTEQGAAMEFLGAFPQSNLNAVPAVRTAVEIGRAGHVVAFLRSPARGDTSRRDESPLARTPRLRQDIVFSMELLSWGMW